MNADHIARWLAACSGGQAESLFAPALADDPHVRKALLEDDTLWHTFDKASRADMALIGIGDVSVDSHMVRMGWFAATDIS